MSTEPISAVLKETGGFKLFEGIVDYVRQETKAGFTFVDIRLRETSEFAESTFEFKAKNEVLAAYRDGRLVAIAPDIITPVNVETGLCITAERIKKGDKLVVLGLPAPQRWRTSRGLELWKDVLQRSEVLEDYVPIEHLQSV